jgi:hypothetical protein
MLACIVLLSAALPTSLIAQSQSGNATWKLLREEKGIRFSYALGECGLQKRLWLRAENSRDTTVMADLTLQVKDNGVLTLVPEQRIEIAAQGTTVIDCEQRGPHAMPIQVLIQGQGAFECLLVSYKAQNLIR